MEQFKNSNMEILRKAAVEANRVSIDAHKAAHEAAENAGEICALINGIQGELNRISAKKTLKIRLTERERAIWTLFGKTTKR